MQTLTRVFLGRTRQDGVLEQVARGALGSLGLKLAYTGLSFVIGVWLARLLGAAGYGAYAYAMAWIALLGVPALLGLDNLLVREVAVLRAAGAWGLLAGLLRWANGTVLLVSLGLALLAGCATLALPPRFDAGMLAALRVVLVLLPLVAATRLRQATLQGLERVVAGQLPDLLLAPLLVVALIGATTLVLGWPLSAAGAVALQVLAAAVALAVGAWLLHGALPPAVLAATPEYRAGQWLRSALPLVFVAGMHVVNSRTDTLMLGALRGAEAVGIYGVASRGAELVSFLLLAAHPALAPAVASLAAAGDAARLQDLVSRSTRWILLASLPLAAALIGAGHWFLALFGPGFAPGRVALAVLAGAQLVNVAVGPVGLLLIMSGHERDAARGVGIAAVSNVVLNALLIPRLGVDGAALATAVSLILWNVLLAHWVVRRIGIHPTVLGGTRAGPA